MSIPWLCSSTTFNVGFSAAYNPAARRREIGKLFLCCLPHHQITGLRDPFRFAKSTVDVVMSVGAARSGVGIPIIRKTVLWHKFLGGSPIYIKGHRR